MNLKMKDLNKPRLTPELQRERALFLYHNALTRGDFATVERILDEASRDPELEAMIIQAHDASDQEVAFQESTDARKVRQLVREHLQSGLPEADLSALPPLTVSDVCAHIQTKAAVKGGDTESGSVMRELRLSEAPLPQELTGRGLRQFFTNLGVSVSEKFQEIFRDAAIFLSMSREQGAAHMSAARRQARGKSAPKKTSPPKKGRSKR